MTVGQAAVFAVFVFVTVVVVMDWAVAVSVSVIVETTYANCQDQSNRNTFEHKPCPSAQPSLS